VTPYKFDESHVAQLPVSQWKAILAVAYDGPWNAYQLSRKYEMKPPVMHRAIKALVRLGWVKACGRVRTSKNVKAINYRLTAEGVLWLLAKRPKDIPPPFYDELWKRGKYHVMDEDEIPAKDVVAKPFEESIDSVKNMKAQEDVHMHLLFDLDVDRIAEKNAELFPAVFGVWEIHKKATMSGSITFFLPEIAFSTLSECCHGYEGLLEKYGTVDQVFAYKIYRKIIENEARISPEMNLESEEEHVEHVWRWVQDVSATVPQFSAMYKDIVLDLKKRFAESLSFTEKMASRVSSST
jgi:hypothetical protein